MSDNNNSDQTLESYKNIFESNLDAILLTHPDGTIFYANSAAEELYGYTQQEICDLGRSGIVDTNDPNLQVILDERARLGKSKGELTLIKKDGSKFLAEVSTSIFKDKNGKVNTFMTIRDITHRKQNEKQIEYNSLLLSQVNDAVIGSDPKFRVTYWNKGAELMYGYTETEALGKISTELLRPTYARGERERIIDELEHKGTSKVTIKTKHQNGEEIIVEANSNLLKDKTGNTTGYVVIYRDITEHKRAEERNQKLLESEQQLTEELQTSNEELQSTTNELLVANEKLLNQKNKLKSSNIQLEESKSELQSIFDLAPVIIMIAHDPECSKITGNSYANEIMQVSMGENISHSVPIKDQAVSYKVFQDNKELQSNELPAQVAASTGEPVEESEYDLLFDDGRIVKLLFGAVPLFNNEGKVRGSIASGMDITNYKLIEESLRESEERLRLAQIRGNIGIWDWNIFTDELNFTPELEQLYGLNPGTIKTYQDWRQLTHPDDIEKIEEERNDKIAKHESFDLEFRIFHKSGNIHWLSARGGALYDKEGKVTRVLGINTDITQRKKAEESLKESEERYHSLFDNNHAVMLLINPDNGDIIDANPAATHFYGYKYDELVKMNINIINVLSEEEIHDRMQKSVSSQQNNFLFKHQLASGEIRDVDVYSGTIILGGKKLLYSIVHDVTDRVIAQDKLKESNEELERFAYVSSHDLQEPLRMVTSFTQLLERKYKGRLDDDADDYIEFIVDGAKRMKLLIDDLLTFSRLNTKPRENELVNLETVLDTVLLNLKVSIEENNVQITQDSLPSIHGDLSRKVQVFQNLISNAIKFNDKKITKIHISAEKEGNEWILNVSDNGIGIDAKHLERIFTIFQRLNNREEYEGTGIGLAITQKIIQQQGGEIWVESEPGKGSTFYFTIPVNS